MASANPTRIHFIAYASSATLAVMLMLLATPALAQSCSFTNTGLDFGTVDLTAGKKIRTSGTLTATCTGTPHATIRVCANFGSGNGGVGSGGSPRYMSGASGSLNYNIYKDASNKNIWGSSVWPYSPTPQTFVVKLRNTGNKSVSLPVRGFIYPNQNGTASGLYVSSFSGNHSLMSFAYASAGNCNVISAGTGVQVPFTVTANVTPSCTVSATDLNFGTTGILATNQDAANTISVSCANNTPFAIGLDGGLNSAGDPTLRNMTNGAYQITYGIFQDAGRTIAWGDTIGANTISGTGNGTTQNFTAYGRVSAQITPPAGTYSDTIVVTMTY